MDNSGDQILRTIKETMRILRLGRTAIYARINDGRLQVVRLSRRATRITLESIQRQIDAGAERPPAESTGRGGVEKAQNLFRV